LEVTGAPQKEKINTCFLKAFSNRSVRSDSNIVLDAASSEFSVSILLQVWAKIGKFGAA
jgi:hypothetical protein